RLRSSCWHVESGCGPCRTQSHSRQRGLLRPSRSSRSRKRLPLPRRAASRRVAYALDSRARRTAMSFLKRLFGGGAAEPKPVGDSVEYNGYTIQATPYREDGQYQTCGVVIKETGQARREHRFVRADRFPTAEDAAAHAIRKGKQLVDEQGEALFD